MSRSRRAFCLLCCVLLQLLPTLIMSGVSLLYSLAVLVNEWCDGRVDPNAALAFAQSINGPATVSRVGRVPTTGVDRDREPAAAGSASSVQLSRLQGGRGTRPSRALFSPSTTGTARSSSKFVSKLLRLVATSIAATPVSSTDDIGGSSVQEWQDFVSVSVEHNSLVIAMEEFVRLARMCDSEAAYASLSDLERKVVHCVQLLTRATGSGTTRPSLQRRVADGTPSTDTGSDADVHARDGCGASAATSATAAVAALVIDDAERDASASVRSAADATASAAFAALRENCLALLGCTEVLVQELVGAAAVSPALQRLRVSVRGVDVVTAVNSAPWPAGGSLVDVHGVVTGSEHAPLAAVQMPADGVAVESAAVPAARGRQCRLLDGFAVHAAAPSFPAFIDAVSYWRGCSLADGNVETSVFSVVCVKVCAARLGLDSHRSVATLRARLQAALARCVDVAASCPGGAGVVLCVTDCEAVTPSAHLLEAVSSADMRIDGWSLPCAGVAVVVREALGAAGPGTAMPSDVGMSTSVRRDTVALAPSLASTRGTAVSGAAASAATRHRAHVVTPPVSVSAISNPAVTGTTATTRAMASSAAPVTVAVSAAAVTPTVVRVIAPSVTRTSAVGASSAPASSDARAADAGAANVTSPVSVVVSAGSAAVTTHVAVRAPPVVRMSVSGISSATSPPTTRADAVTSPVSVVASAAAVTLTIPHVAAPPIIRTSAATATATTTSTAATTSAATTTGTATASAVPLSTARADTVTS